MLNRQQRFVHYVVRTAITPERPVEREVVEDTFSYDFDEVAYKAFQLAADWASQEEPPVPVFPTSPTSVTYTIKTHGHAVIKFAVISEWDGIV